MLSLSPLRPPAFHSGCGPEESPEWCNGRRRRRTRCKTGQFSGPNGGDNQMSGLTVRQFDAPDESRTPAKAKVDVIDLGAAKAARMALEPGWRWSECIKPVVGGDSCQAHHVGVIVSGAMHVVHNDGTEAD